MDNMQKELEFLVNVKYWSIRQIARALGVTHRSVMLWFKGAKMKATTRTKLIALVQQERFHVRHKLISYEEAKANDPKLTPLAHLIIQGIPLEQIAIHAGVSHSKIARWAKFTSTDHNARYDYAMARAIRELEAVHKEEKITDLFDNELKAKYDSINDPVPQANQAGINQSPLPDEAKGENVDHNQVPW